MTNKILWGVAVMALALGGYAVFAGHASAPSTFSSVSAYQAMNNQNLLTTLQTINAPLANIPNGTTAAIDFPNLTNASGTSAQSTTTVVTGVAASLGDAVLVMPNTPTTGAAFIGQVSTASTTSATITITEQANTLNTAVDATSTTFNVIVLPASTFKSSGA